MKTPQLPIPRLASALGLNQEIWIKREDKHHYGSHKGRSIPFMITTYFKEGIRRFVISSSGNAALAAIMAIQAHNKNKPSEPLDITVFIGNNIPDHKKELLFEKAQNDDRIVIKQTSSPKQAAILCEKETGAKLLRQSTDDIALIGYTELAKELAKMEHLQAVFIPTSSGTAAQGLSIGFAQIGINPQIHIVQTALCHPLVEALKPETKKITAEASLAGAIVDKVAHRTTTVIQCIQTSNGSGWVATDEDILKAITLAQETGLEISPNSALSVVGLQKAIAEGTTWNGPVVCLITGQ